MICQVCSGQLRERFRHRILGRHDAAYLYCPACGFLRTEQPFWLEEAYSEAIAETDTGLLSRNIFIAQRLCSLFYVMFRSSGSYLDAAGGYGVLTRRMRDFGYDYYWSDAYCANLFARGWEARPGQTFTAVSAVEVFEHLEDPLDFVRSILSASGCSTLVFTTELFSGEPPAPDEWWYYAFETGQHIAFYQERTLQRIAQSLSLRFYSAGGLHMFTDLTLDRRLFTLAAGRWSRLIGRYARQRLDSLTMRDREARLADLEGPLP